MRNPEQKKKLLENYGKYSSIAFQMIAIILLGVFGGIKLDALLNFKFPVLTVILAVLSVILAIYYVTRDFLRRKK